MSIALQEFNDKNLHRSYPLVDSAGAVDITGTFTLPSALITDIYLCAPNLPNIDICKFYIQNIVIRQFFIDITLGYDDPAVPLPIGVFKNISTQAPLHSTYRFVPAETQSGDAFTPLYHMTGQITIGDSAEALQALGSWNFTPIDDEHSTFISPSRVGQGLLNVQYISINDRLFTGNIKLREGANVEMEVETQTVDGVVETTITLNATLNAGAPLQLNNDQDVLDALVAEYGAPLLSVNGLLPDSDRNFNIFGVDCTAVEGTDNGLLISNPCASPCCDEDTNIENIMTSINNLNLRYAQLKSYFDSQSATINDLQNKLLVLGAEV